MYRVSFSKRILGLPFTIASVVVRSAELPAVSLDTVLFREAGGQTAWKVMERR